MNTADMFVALVRDRDRATQCNRATWAWPPESVNVEFHPPSPEGDDGRYDPDTETVAIFRRGCMPWDESFSPIKLAADSPCPLSELLTFAHELGHHDARRLGLPFIKDGTAAEYTSEVWGWEVGRWILASRGFTDWPDFENRSRANLSTYRVGLGLTDGEAEEIQARIRREAPSIIEAAVQPAPVAADNPAAGTSM